ncbi:MAG: adenosylcobinamide-GDP ribazoletransferase [Rhizobiaceae bacterium]
MTLPDPKDVLTDLRVALVFFTRLPLPHGADSDRPFASSLWAAPLAGLVVGLCGTIAYAIASGLGVPPAAAAAAALGAMLAATGCLHEDGLCDTADGLGGGRTKERKLEIMRDSRIGTFGASALAVALIARWSALATLPDAEAVLWALVAAECGSRAVLPAFMAFTPAARNDGLAAAVGTVSRDVAGVSVILGGAALLCLGVGTALFAAFLLAALAIALRSLVMRLIGGQTGDTVGALQQGAEVIVLMAASAAFTAA